MNTEEMLYAFHGMMPDRHVPGKLEQCPCVTCTLALARLKDATAEEMEQLEAMSLEHLKDAAIFTLRELRYMLGYVEGFTVHARHIAVRIDLMLAMFSKKYGM